jgi:hypothetical protein
MNYAAIFVALLALMSAASACVDCDKSVGFSFSTSSSQLGSFGVSDSVNAFGDVEFGGQFASSPFTGVQMETQASGEGKGICYTETTSAYYLKHFGGIDPWSFQKVEIQTANKNDQFQLTTDMFVGEAFSGLTSSGLVSTDKFALTEHYDNFEGYVWDASVSGFNLGQEHKAISYKVTNGFSDIGQVTHNVIEVGFGELP